MKDKTKIYLHSAVYARENNELPEYRASYKANVACRDAIDAAISKHYRDNTLSRAAVQEVAAQFGFDRMLYVVANTIRHKDWDGRISFDNKQWAKSFAVVHDIGGMGDDRTIGFVANSHPGLFDLFAEEARHAFLLTQPLKAAEIKQEAARILSKLQAQREPNSPNGTHFMVEISPDFLARASSKNTDRLFSMLPFRSLSFSSLKDRKGIYALVTSDEDRSKPLRTGRKQESLLGKLEVMKADSPERGKTVSKKQHDTER